MTTTTAPGNYLDLNGARLVSCRVTIGASGPWIADVTTATDEPIPGGPMALRIGALVLTGAVMRDQAFAASRGLLLVGGAGGWGKTVPPQAYHNEPGIPRALPLADVAAAAGEVIAPAELAAATDLLGADFVREAAPAARVLEQLVGPGWWVDAAGLTHILPRVGAPIASPFLIEHYDRATGRLLVSTENVEDWTPGAVVAGPQMPVSRSLSSVTIDARPDGALRVEALTAPVAALPTTDRLLGLLRTLIRSELAPLSFYRIAEYSVVSVGTDGAGNPTVDAVPVALAGELPAIVQCPVRPALGGATVQLAPGASVGVAWMNGDPARPMVVLADYTLPTSTIIQASESAGISAPVLNVGDGGFDPVALANPLLAWGAALKLALGPAVPIMPPTIAATRLKAS